MKLLYIINCNELPTQGTFFNLAVITEIRDVLNLRLHFTDF